MGSECKVLLDVQEEKSRILCFLDQIVNCTMRGTLQRVQQVGLLVNCHVSLRGENRTKSNRIKSRELIFPVF